MNTQDLGKFGYRELDMAADILKALANPSKTSQAEDLEMEDNIKLEFNPNSGNVFIVDDSGHTAMMNGEQLENWIYCECGHEDFKSEFKKETPELNSIDDGYFCPECGEEYNV